MKTPTTIMRATLFPRQLEIMKFIEAFTGERGYAPTYEEIKTAVGLHSVSTVHKHILHLVRKGFIADPQNGKRKLVVMDRQLCPHCGGKL